MNRPRRSIVVILGVLAIQAITGCGEEEDIEGVVVDSFSETELASISDTLLIDDKSFVIQASLNRDFMPVSPPDGRPLTVLAKLRTVEEQPFAWVPADPKFFVVVGNRMWIVVPTIDVQVDPAEQQLYAGSGPKWGPGVEATVIFTFKDGEGTAHRIVDRQVLIDRSE